MEKLLKKELRVLAITTRERLCLTQKEMADRLEMSESSYSDIETGKYMCGTLTAVLLFSELENPDAYFKEMSKSLSELYGEALETV